MISPLQDTTSDSIQALVVRVFRSIEQVVRVEGGEVYVVRAVVNASIYPPSNPYTHCRLDTGETMAKANFKRRRAGKDNYNIRVKREKAR